MFGFIKSIKKAFLDGYTQGLEVCHARALQRVVYISTFYIR